MSLKTRFGNLKNVLDESSAQTEILVLDSPFVGNVQFERLLENFNAPMVEIDCTFPTGGAPGTCKRRSIAFARKPKMRCARALGIWF